ncbi:MAG TPA: c-type cytochrome [Desulfuromonadales bacterium]|nr:c-type cytochrome [Desulfuromonadales bacterium]
MRVISAALFAACLCLSTATAQADDVESRGRALLNGLGCKACHSFEGQGGRIGPSLDTVGKRLDEDRIRRQLLTPREINPESSMPSYDHLEDWKIDTLVEFLARQK